MKNRFIVPLITIMICLSLSACGTKDNNSLTKESEVSVKEPNVTDYFDFCILCRDNDKEFKIAYDKNTNVMYFLKTGLYSECITPIYNADGSLKLYQEETPPSDDKTISEYVDSDTGVHYLIYSPNADGKMGGITPRLNPDGSIMTDK